MKILIASMGPFMGGAEVAAERLAVGLQQAGHEVCVVLGNDNEVRDRIARSGIRTVVTPMCYTDKWHWLRYRAARDRLRELFIAEHPDVVHSNDLNTHQIASDAAQGLATLRICHHRWLFEGAAADWLNKFGSDMHLFVSQALMKALCASSRTLDGSPRAVVYDGLPLPEVPRAEERRAARSELKLPSDGVIVTFAGQIIERKGVADLLRAWALMSPAAREPAALLIIGDDLENQGAYRAAMERLSAELNVPARFVGFQKNVPRWLTASDIAVVPSHVEPLGNATLEAMAYALPVIGGDVGGIPEMIVAGETGLLVPARSPDQLARAIEQLIMDRALAHRLGQAGRARCAEKFSLQAHVDAVLKQYQSVPRQLKIRR